LDVSGITAAKSGFDGKTFSGVILLRAGIDSSVWLI
jgi:hypothetical protein